MTFRTTFRETPYRLDRLIVDEVGATVFAGAIFVWAWPNVFALHLFEFASLPSPSAERRQLPVRLKANRIPWCSCQGSSVSSPPLTSAPLSSRKLLSMRRQMCTASQRG